MEIKLIYIEDLDGNWFKVIINGVTITAFKAIKALGRLDREAEWRAEKSFNELIRRLQKPLVEETIKSVTI